MNFGYCGCFLFTNPVSDPGTEWMKSTQKYTFFICNKEITSRVKFSSNEILQ